VFVQTGFRTHAATLFADFHASYPWVLERHLSDLVDEPLRAIDVPGMVVHQHHLLGSGRAPNTTREAPAYLSAIRQVAAGDTLIPGNRVRSVRKSTAVRHEVWSRTLVQLEALVAALRGRNRIVVVLAGRLGPRPKEARSVPWHLLSRRTLLVGKSRTRRPRVGRRRST
jgi:hypothetical protein